MLIGVSGPPKSGRQEVIAILETEGFKVLATESQNIRSATATVFASFTELADHALAYWRNDFVYLIDSEEALAVASRRPYFLHVGVDAPLLVRWGRAQTQRGGKDNSPSLESFVTLSDAYFYEHGGAEIGASTKISFVNAYSDLSQLSSAVVQLRLRDGTRMRPTWDAYFMALAEFAALRSNCMKRCVGCVLVRDKRILATGYNGTPRGLTNCNEGGCPRCNQGSRMGGALDTCLCLHAEENALLEAGRDRIGTGTVIYCNTCPCLTCSIKIVQTGITEVIYSQSYSMDALSAKIFHEAGVVLRQYVPPSAGLVPANRLSG